MRTRRHGFTVLELLAVIALIGILAAILLPALARAREAGRRVACLSNLSQIGIALRIYADENNRELPWSGGNNDAYCLVSLHADASLSPFLFVCPSDSSFFDEELYDYETGRPLDMTKLSHDLNTVGLRGSYDYFGAYTRTPIATPLPTRQAAKVPIMWDIGSAYFRGSNHAAGGSNVLWLDGSVSFRRSEDFPYVNLPYLPQGIEFDYLDFGDPDDESDETAAQ